MNRDILKLLESGAILVQEVKDNLTLYGRSEADEGRTFV